MEQIKGKGVLSANMSSLQPCSCVVHVDIPGKKNELSSDQGTPSQSCSGLILDPQKGLVLTTGGLFSHVLSTSDLEGTFPLHNLSAEYAIKVIVSSEHNSSETETFVGHLVGIWSSDKMRSSLEKLFKSDGWSFQGDFPQDGEFPRRGGGGEGETPQHHGVSKESCKAESSEDSIQWLSSFALIKVNDFSRTKPPVSFSILPSADILPGLPVGLSGTPFGSLCPPVFANSYAGGVISNVASDTLILTDVRCLPGTEGAPLFVHGHRNRRPQVVGIVVAPMCWKTNQWVGLSVACSFHEVLLSMLQKLPGAEIDLPQHLEEAVEGSSGTIGRCHNFFNSITLVRVGSSWGSGVVIHSKKKLLLTCRHVVVDAVNNNHTVFVRADKEANTWHRAKVIFSTNHKSVIDLAIIQLSNHSSSDLKQIPLSSDTYAGEPLFAVGFPLFGPETHLGASVTSGHVSKVIRHKGLPVMLQTSCAIHPGSSGGALLSKKTGQLVGIIANNCRDDTNRVTIPHLNFGIPSSIFRKPLRKYIQTGDISFLNALNIFDKEVESLWKLQSLTSSEDPLKSKL